MSYKKIIIVIPCYNEGEALLYTVDALENIKKLLRHKYQLDIMLINDGSSDDTQEVINRAAGKNHHIYFRQLAKNSGHQSALRAGLNASIDYDAVIMMDADLQHPPELIPEMLSVWERGINIVQMAREDNRKEKDKSLFKYLAAKNYYKLINWLSDLNLEYGASDFRLIDKTVTQAVSQSTESNLFLRGYFSWLPVSRETIVYQPNARIAGSSKYSIKKLLDLARKGVMQFSERPLRIATNIGLLFAVGSFLYGIYIVAMYFWGSHEVSGWTSLMVLLLFCFGVNFILIGVVGSYLAHSITLQKNRPEYIIASERLP